MLVKKGLKVKIFPTPEQANLIDRTIGCCRFVYNQTLTEMLEAKDKTGHYTTRANRSSRLVSLKDEYPWLKEPDAHALQSAIKDFNQAVDYHFNNKKHFRFPNPKKKHSSTQSYRTPVHGSRTRVCDEYHIKVPKVGVIKTKKICLPKDYKLLNITIIHKNSGKYYASICYETEVVELPKTGKQAGFDLGLIDLIISSDGLKIQPPKFGRTLQDKLAKEQRKLSKMRIKLMKAKVDLDTAKNYQKQKHKIAKLYEHIANQRKDFNHKLSKWLVENYDFLAFENLNVKGLLKNHTLSYSISDVAWSQLLSMIEYKALWYGKKFIKINRFYASSKICSSCGSYHKDIVNNLGVREWICPNCGTHHDRDVNAAKNILKYAMSVA